MRVKRLELFGFKSFAQKTAIRFEPGVTAIVGPNGSGKSNVVDSIRWVLGEHNPRDVRAPRLEDVIFNGTDQKAPLSVAEVHLTIENEQGVLPVSFSEVTISRRVYRSGESECFINQSPCRLRDIQELFLGTGLGGGAYAIIEQGHIDLVLSSKPEERRVVFEEASGIAKYLVKKKETQRRLDETEEHLVRIADITGEVRRQVSALERQANKARQYKNRWEELKNIELRMAADALRKGESSFADSKRQVALLSTKREALEAQKQGHVASVNTQNARVSQVQQELQALRTEVMGRSSQIQQHESQAEITERWINEIIQQRGQVEDEERQARERASQFDEQLAGIAKTEAELEKQRTDLESRRKEDSAKLSTAEADLQAVIQTIEEAKPKLFEAATDATQSRNQVTEISSRLQTIEVQLDRLIGARTQLANRASDVRSRYEALVREREALEKRNDELKVRLGFAQQAMDSAQASRHELMGRFQQLREQMANERAKVKVLEDLWRRYEGFPEAVKTLMGASIEGVIGPMVDLVQAAPGYEAMVEAALGPLAEAVVVQDRRAMSQARKELSARGLSECRFLVLSDCRAPGVKGESLTPRAGVSGAVAQFVRTQPKYQPLVDWLLDDSWLTEDFERLLVDPSIPEQRLVSPRGDRWDRRSWRFNGLEAAGRTRGDEAELVGRRLGCKQRWEDALSRLQSLEHTAGETEGAVVAAERNWQDCLSHLESAKSEPLHLASTLNRFTTELSELGAEGRSAEDEKRGFELECEDLTTQREELRKELQTSQQMVQETESLQHKIEAALAQAQSQRDASEENKRQLLLSNAQLDATWQSVAERSSAMSARCKELESDRSHILKQIEVRTRQQQETAARLQELKRQLQDHRQAKEQLELKQSELARGVECIAQKVREEEEKRDEAVPKLLAVEKELSALIVETQEQDKMRAEREFSRSRVLERLRELYQIDEATLDAERHTDTPPLSLEQCTDLSEQIKTLRAKLEGIGSVSMGSVEEYDELKRRLEFMQTQQKDLVQARDDLKTSIAQINRSARAQFREMFERIRKEFQHYFSRLFQGGNADVILLDNEDVLESGIDIVARPPGKRLQSISLLSGGERALTATALLFALFKVRPSPFCILDEIDAPLDEANVDRFTRVLEEFLSLSQFILITHNKKTITRADCLYGVTMEEAGVSKILSAKLTKAKGHTALPPRV